MKRRNGEPWEILVKYIRVCDIFLHRTASRHIFFVHIHETRCSKIWRLFPKGLLLLGLGQVVGQGDCVVLVDLGGDLVEAGDEGVLQPVHNNFGPQDGETVGGEGPEALLPPAVLLHRLQHHHEQQGKQVESLSHIRAWHLTEKTEISMKVYQIQWIRIPNTNTDPDLHM